LAGSLVQCTNDRCMPHNGRSSPSHVFGGLCPRPWKNATEEAADALCFAGVRVEKPAMTLCFRFLAIPMTAPRTMDSGQRRILASPAELKGIIKHILLY
jgi:hypothetical protein